MTAEKRSEDNYLSFRAEGQPIPLQEYRPALYLGVDT